MQQHIAGYAQVALDAYQATKKHRRARQASPTPSFTSSQQTAAPAPASSVANGRIMTTCFACGKEGVHYGLPSTIKSSTEKHLIRSWTQMYCRVCGDRFDGEGLLKLRKRCRACPRYACFGRPDCFSPSSCHFHREPAEIDIMHRGTTCKFQGGCTKQASFGTITQQLDGTSKLSRPIVCGKHRDPGHVDVSRALCHENGCKNRAFYGTRGNNTGRFCRFHRSAEQVDLRHKLCKHAGCYLRASFAASGTTPRYCRAHR